MALGFDASKLHLGKPEHGGNKTESSDKRHGGKHEGKLNTAALTGVIAQVISIVAAVCLIVVAALHRVKFRPVLLVWLVWTIIGLVIIIVTMIVRVAVFKSHFIDIIITLLASAYLIFSFWIVLSYYKFLGDLEDRPDLKYNQPGTDKEILAEEEKAIESKD